MVQSSDGEIHTDSKSIADVLQRHFSSVYSDPCSNDIKSPSFPVPRITHDMNEDALNFSEEDIISAIKEIKPNSAPGPDEIPTQLLKNCANSVSFPISLMWKASLSTVVVLLFIKTPSFARYIRREIKFPPVTIGRLALHLTL